TNTAMRLVLCLEAAAFVGAALVHSGVALGGYEHREATIAESVIAVVLLTSLAMTWAGSLTAHKAGLVAQAIALLGTLIGVFTIAIGVGPSTAPDIAFHVAVVPALLLGLVAIARMRGL
ncbi:MAG: hypothetical protein ACREDZ_00925, partial [Kiloniellales bacterium]